MTQLQDKILQTKGSLIIHNATVNLISGYPMDHIVYSATPITVLTKSGYQVSSYQIMCQDIICPDIKCPDIKCLDIKCPDLKCLDIKCPNIESCLHYASISGHKHIWILRHHDIKASGY